MSSLRHRLRSHREAARHSQALRRALSTTTSKAVKDELLASLGR